MKKGLSTICFTALLLATSIAKAELTWTGFLTAAGAAANVRFLNTGVEPIYAEHIGKQISFDADSALGIQLQKQLDESLSAIGRVVAAGRTDWDARVTRAYFDYRPSENWHWRLGRMPILYLIHSENVFESFQNSWLALPDSLYRMIPFHYLDAANAGLKIDLFNRDLIFEATYGALTEHTTTPISDIEHKYKLRQVAHLMGSFGNELVRLHASYTVGRVTWGPNAANELINTFMNGLIRPSLIGIDYQNYLTVKNERLLYQSIGYTFHWKRLVSNAEFLRRKSSATVIPNITAWYAMAGCEFYDDKVLPFIAFTRQRVMDNDTRRFVSTANNAALVAPPAGLGRTLDSVVQEIAEGIDGPAAGDQSTYVIGVRWLFLDMVSVKAQFEHIHPDRRGSGLFNVHPHKSINMYRVGIDSSFSA